MNSENEETGRGGIDPHTHERESMMPLGISEDSDLEFVSDDETVIEGSEPTPQLPTFPQQGSAWPELVKQVVDLGRTPAQRDVLLLGILNVIGATLGPKVRTLYDGKWLSPCMMLFVVAPPASGKGVLAWLRHIVQPFHDELRHQYEAQMKAYKMEKLKFDTMGKSKGTAANIQIPEPPVRKFFLIPGNNSGTGMAVNLINSDGRGIIFETEADTLSAALNTDYGHFDDCLRNTFDHERISLFRRTENMSYEQTTSFLSIVLSGTPGQVKPLIESVENGLASRFQWYYMPALQKWQNQFDRKEDMTAKFRQLGQLWKKTVDEWKTVSNFTFELDDLQQELFNFYLGTLLDRGLKGVGSESVSCVIRTAHHLLRIMSVVALLRIYDDYAAYSAKQPPSSRSFTRYFFSRESHTPLLRPAEDVPSENLADGICPRYVYGINNEDFPKCLCMANTLFRHAMHILSLLPAVDITNRGSATREFLFNSMEDEFLRKDYLDKAGELNINENTALQWLKRGLRKGQLLKTGRGKYIFTQGLKNEL